MDPNISRKLSIQAYHQLELTELSRYITTFSTHEGLFRYKRLNYGTNSAPEIFQNNLQQNLSDISGLKNTADDIIWEAELLYQNCYKTVQYNFATSDIREKKKN